MSEIKNIIYNTGVQFPSLIIPTGSQPLDSRTIVQSLPANKSEFTAGAVYLGMTVSCLADKNFYMLTNVATDGKLTWQQVGKETDLSNYFTIDEAKGLFNKTVSTEADLKGFATSDTIGQHVYLTVDIKDGESTKYSTGLYVVTGAGTVQKLATSSATGDYGADIAAINTKLTETIEPAIDDINDELDAIKNGEKDSISYLSKWATDNTNRIYANKDTLDQVKKDIGIINGNIDAIGLELDAIKNGESDSISYLSIWAMDNSNKIYLNKAAIDENKANIGDINRDIESINNSLDNLSSITGAITAGEYTVGLPIIDFDSTEESTVDKTIDISVSYSKGNIDEFTITSGEGEYLTTKNYVDSAIANNKVKFPAGESTTALNVLTGNGDASFNIKSSYVDGTVKLSNSFISEIGTDDKIVTSSYIDKVKETINQQITNSFNTVDGRIDNLYLTTGELNYASYYSNKYDGTTKINVSFAPGEGKIKFDFDSKDTSGLASKNYVDQKIIDLMGSEDLHATLDTLQEISKWIDDDPTDATELTVSLAELTKEVGAIDTTVDGHTTQIGVIDTTVGGHTTEIATINSTVAGHTTDITNINTEITTINTRLTWEVIA